MEKQTSFEIVTKEDFVQFFTKHNVPDNVRDADAILRQNLPKVKNEWVVE